MSETERWTITPPQRVGRPHDYGMTLTTVMPRPAMGGEPFDVVPASRLQEATDRIAVLETALELACSDGWPDGKHVAKLYTEQAERKLAAVLGLDSLGEAPE